ncbi:ABC transporter permease [Natrinema versiforme]|uniref:ABC-type spermidine/putrescine transport system, permease component I n=1 Tax=Natrinema versiforme JCM 10478 TaxID=1227496 RepID=L9Y5H0_9EURY|nr:ABC transporter permease [Natrinema versiforme]ELY68967.1 ABC-type spermidine/putrescine transport system, permease component I [Natrinema versiforme JCM 10478]
MSVREFVRSKVPAAIDRPGRRLASASPLGPPGGLMLPLLALLAFMFVGPIVAIVLFSVQTENVISLSVADWTLEAYREIVQGTLSGEGVYGEVTLNTIVISALTTVVAFVVSYPAAYALATKVRRFKLPILIALIIPLFTSVNIRVYGWVLFLINDGVFDLLAGSVGLNAPSIIYTRSAVVLGTVYVYLPYMLFPIYLSISTIDESLLEAASDLGAGRTKQFVDVILPLSKPGVIIGSLFVFVLSLGAEVEAELLGGGTIYTAASNISYSFGYSQNWPLGSAQAVGLLLITTVCGVVILRTIDLTEIASRGGSR